MIIVRSILALITAIVTVFILAICMPLCVIATLYWGITEGDWREEQWREFVPMFQEMYDELKAYILNKPKTEL